MSTALRRRRYTLAPPGAYNGPGSPRATAELTQDPPMAGTRIPAEALPAFNDAIVGEIEIVAEFGATEDG
jgi:hypothetical protein